MNSIDFDALGRAAINGETLDRGMAEAMLAETSMDLLRLLDTAFQVRQVYWGREVTIHILNNAANGYCPEDCGYCAQSKNSRAAIEEYPLKSDEEILAEAKTARENGAHRYCMVFAGRGPSPRRVEKIASLVERIKQEHGIEVCVSAGLLDEDGARRLKQSGLDRLNHNLNTSRKNYPSICTTHTYDDRVRTLQAADQAGLEVCSGVIVGMGESVPDLVDLAFELRRFRARSIPVNFLLPIEGAPLGQPRQLLTPQYCLRVLCMFRLMNPDAEIRAAAGREYHLRSMEVMALYPANSIFLQGYLNARGQTDARTLKMIQDAGFTIKSDVPLEELIGKSASQDTGQTGCGTGPALKQLHELRPRVAQTR